MERGLDQIQRLVLQHAGLRIEPEMARYVQRQLHTSAASVPVIGGDARTGIPRRQTIQLRLLQSPNEVRS